MSSEQLDQLVLRDRVVLKVLRGLQASLVGLVQEVAQGQLVHQETMVHQEPRVPRVLLVHREPQDHLVLRVLGEYLASLAAQDLKDQ